MTAESFVIKYTRELPTTEGQDPYGDPIVRWTPVECSTVVHTVREVGARTTIRLKGVQGVRGGQNTWGPPARSRGRYDFNADFVCGVPRGA